MKKPIGRRVALLLTVFAAALGVSIPVGAHENTMVAGPTNLRGCNYNVADNGTHTFYYSSATMTSQWMIDAMLWNRQQNLDPTDINTQGLSSSNASTDVIAYTGDWSGPNSCNQVWCCENGGTFSAVAWVESVNVAQEAEQFRIYIDTDALFLRSVNYHRAVACHETAHTLGLYHKASTCVTDPLDENLIRLGTHQVSHLNGYTGYNDY